MQKMMIKLLLLIFMSAGFCHAAFADDEMLTCPSVSTIQDIKFTEAVEDSSQGGIWQLSSDPFKIEDNEWNVWFGAYLPNAKVRERAVPQGQDYFNISALDEPAVIYDKKLKMTVCNYAPAAKKYFVLAFSPSQKTLPRQYAPKKILIDMRLLYNRKSHGNEVSSG